MKGDYCNVHDPEKVAKKEAEREAIAKVSWARRRKEIHGAAFYKALEEIAEGHNDPRALANEVLDKFDNGL